MHTNRIADKVGEKNFNIISVLGPKRAGKSTFISSLSGDINTFEASDAISKSFTMGSHAACNLPTLEDFAAASTPHDQMLVGGKSGIYVGFLDQEGLNDQNKADYLPRLVNTKWIFKLRVSNQSNPKLLLLYSLSLV
jgi:hypothetical protein